MTEGMLRNGRQLKPMSLSYQGECISSRAKRLLLSHSLQSRTTNIQRIFREGLSSTGESGAEEEEKEEKAVVAPAEALSPGLEAQAPSLMENSSLALCCLPGSLRSTGGVGETPELWGCHSSSLVRILQIVGLENSSRITECNCPMSSSATSAGC